MGGGSAYRCPLPRIPRRCRRRPGLGLSWSASFAEDELGNAVRDDALLATARVDHEVVVESGLAVQLRNAPKMRREAFEQMQPEELLGRFVFEPGPGIPVTISAHAASGAAVSREVTVYRFPPVPWQPMGSMTGLWWAWTARSCRTSRSASWMTKAVAFRLPFYRN